jgi:hypothetical protein
MISDTPFRLTSDDLGHRQSTELLLVLGWFALVTRFVASLEFTVEKQRAFGETDLNR